MLLCAVSVLVVTQSSSEIPEGLMNNPVELVKLHLISKNNVKVVQNLHTVCIFQRLYIEKTEILLIIDKIMR